LLRLVPLGRTSPAPKKDREKTINQRPFDPREVVVIAFTEIGLEQAPATLQIDVQERLPHSLDDAIEPEIERKFGLLVSEDDFSASGPLDYKPSTVHGKEMNLEEFAQNLRRISDMISEEDKKRDRVAVPEEGF
jgi:hypothetical protein